MPEQYVTCSRAGFFYQISYFCKQITMNRSSKTRSIKNYPNPNYLNPNSKFNHNEAQHRSIQQSFTQDEIDSSAEPAFETQNYVYQLQSRCNTLEYEKTKNEMAFQNTVSELRQKNAYLQQLASALSQKNQTLAEERDEVRVILSEVREKNHELAKQIEGFKLQVRELESIKKQSFESESSQNLLEQLQQKNEQISQRENQIAALQKQITRYESAQPSYPNQSASLFKKQIGNLEKQLQIVKGELDSALKNQQLVKSLERQKQQLMKQLRLKDNRIASLEDDQAQLQQQLEKYRESLAFKQKKQVFSHGQEVKRLTEAIKMRDQHLQDSQNIKMSLESRLSEMTVELGRVKSQNSGLDQYNKYLQSCNTESETKRKLLQEDLYKSQKDISELRTLLFNQKLENKKLMSNLRLSFEEEKIKHVEQMDDKSKEILKLKELSISSHRQNVDYQDATNRYQSLSSELDKSAQQSSALKAENQKLRQDLKNFENRYDKRNENYATLERDLKNQYDSRIKSLESQIYKLQIENSEMQLKVEYQGKSQNNKLKDAFFQHKNSSEEEQNLSDLVQLLKIQNKQKQQRLRQLNEQMRVRTEKQEEKVGRLQSELRVLKDVQTRSYYNKEETQGRLRAINELQSEITRLNDELRKERQNNDHMRRESSLKEHKLSLQSKRYQQQCESLNRTCKTLKQDSALSERKILQLTSQLKSKQKEVLKYQLELQGLRENLENRKNNEMSIAAIQEAARKSEDSFDAKTRELNRQLGQLKLNKQKQIEQLKQQLKKQTQLREQIENRLKTEKNGDENANKNTELKKKYQDLQKENYQLKIDYSEALQQVNSLLINYRDLEEKHKRQSSKYEDLKNELHQLKSSKVSTDYLMKQVQDYKQLSVGHESQIHRLNQLLMQKQRDMKQMQLNSSSFTPQYHTAHSKEAKKTKETELWLSQNSSRRQELGLFRGSTGYKR